MGMLRQLPAIYGTVIVTMSMEKMTTDQNLKPLGRTIAPYVGQSVIFASVTGFAIYLGLTPGS